MYMVGLGDEDGEKAVESVKVEQWQLRVHRDWKDGCWVPPLEESQVDQQYQQVPSVDYFHNHFNNLNYFRFRYRYNINARANTCIHNWI